MTWVQFWLWVASFLISDYFRERLPSQTAAGIGDFSIPTATEGRPVGVILGGTMRVDAPNCIWYGQFLADEKTVTTGIVFKKEEGVGFRYRLALQYALGKFRATGMTGIWIGDEKVWDHVTDAGGVPQQVVDFANYDMFGGKDSGGGFSGRFRLHNGDDNQAESAYLRDIIGLDPLPAYRGTCYVMITNMSETTPQGFGQFIQSTPETLGAYIGDNNQLRYLRVEVQTFDTVANGGLGDRLQLGNDHHFIGPDANPLSVAYELYLNDRWGRAFPAGDVNQASFKAAAEICYTEGIGFSQLVDEQVSTGDLQDTIEQHIDGYIGPNPVTGQIEVTLSRPDYVLANEFQATDDNIVSVEKWNKGDWSQTFNRTRIRYVDRAKDWNETHAIQVSPGNRIIQGRTVTKELRYQGCHTASVAAILAARLNRTLSLPQSSGTIILDRTAWEIRPGSVMGLTSSQADETDLAVRVTKIALGDGIGNAMKAEVVADISGNEIVVVAEPPPTDFVPPIQTVIPFDPTDQAAFETPFILMRADTSPNSVPRITTLGRRAGANLPTEYEVVRRTAAGTPAGAYTSTDFVTAGFCVAGELRNAEIAGQSGNGALSMQVDGIGGESLDGLITTYGPAVGNFAGVAIISPGLVDEEWIFFDEIVDDLTGIRLENVWRSAMDTPWRAHAAGARVWFIWTGGMGMGGEEYTLGWNVEIKLLPRSPNDEVLEAAATALPIVAIDTNTGVRNAKPLLPASVLFNATEFPAVVDWNTLTTGLPSPDVDVTGLVLAPTHRLWRTQDIQWSMQGLDIGGGGLNPSELTTENMRISCWIMDLGSNPTGARAQAIVEIIDQLAPLTSQGGVYNLYFQQADLLLAVENDGEPVLQGTSFNMRVEIETKHSPPGQVTNNVSHAALQHDCSALGNFPASFDEPLYSAAFNGPDASVVIGDDTQYNSPVAVMGNAQLDRALAVFSASALFDGVGDAIAIGYNPLARIWGPGASHDDDWTVDFRVRFGATNLGVTNQCLFGETAGIPFRSWYIRLSAAGTALNFVLSSSGSNGYVARFSLSWTPVADTWYAVRIVRDRAQWALFVDGTRVSTVTAFWNCAVQSVDLTFGAVDDGATLTEALDGQIDDFRAVQRRLSETTDVSYTVDLFPLPNFAGAHYPLVAHCDGADLDTTYLTDDRNAHTMSAGNTSEVDTAQFKFGTASLRCDGVNTSTTVSDGWIVDETVGARHPAFDFKTGNFFMETHVRFAALPSGDGTALIAKYARTIGDGADWFWVLPNTTTIAFEHWNSGQIASIGGNTGNVAHNLTLAINTWYCFAVERVGNTLNMYADGTRIYQNTTYFDAVPYVLNGRDNGTYFARPVTVGRLYSVGSTTRMRAMDGWIDGVFITKQAVPNGAASYTVPTAPRIIQAGQDTPVRLLWHCDGSQTNDTRGTIARIVFAVQFSSARVKFGSTSLLYPGTSGTYVADIPPSRGFYDLADGDFTIDLWHNIDLAPTQGGMAFINQWLEAGNRRGFRFAWNDTDDALEFEWTTDGSTIKRAFALVALPVLDTWHHWQVVRSGANLYLFLNGALLTLDGASDAIGADVIFNAARSIAVGYQDVTGFTGRTPCYIDEVRITATAENTAGFTPPTAAYADPVLPNF